MRAGSRPGPDLDALDEVAGPDLVHDLHALGHPPEQRVAAVEMGLRRMGDEELAAPRVLLRPRHAHRAPAIGPLSHLAAQLIAGTPVAVAPRITALDDEAGDDAMEAETVVEAAAGEVDEVRGGERRLHHVEVDLDAAVLRVYDCAGRVELHVRPRVVDGHRLAIVERRPPDRLPARPRRLLPRGAQGGAGALPYDARRVVRRRRAQGLERARVLLARERGHEREARVEVGVAERALVCGGQHLGLAGRLP